MRVVCIATAIIGLTLVAAEKPIEVIVDELRVHIREDDSARYARGSELAAKWASEEATLYEITEVSPGELHGSYAEGTKSGTLRMIRSKERRVVK